MYDLTEKRVQRAREPGRYGDGRGLYLRVMPSGAKNWLFRFERAGRERWLGLGPLHTVSLTEAREAARLARLALRDGADPIETRKAERAKRAAAAAKSMTFEEAARAYIDGHKEKWTNKQYKTQFISSLERFAFPVIGKMAVAEIDTPHVLQVIEAKWTAMPVTMNRVRSRIAMVLGWARARGFRQSDNVAQWRGFLDEVLPAREEIRTVQHFSALPFEEVPAFMADLCKRDGFPAAALRLLILTASRTGEIVAAKWSEVDLPARVWTVPAERMKGKKKSKKPHRVPLSPAAVALLETLPREGGNEFVFVGRRTGLPISHVAMLYVLQKMGRDDLTVHGFRASFKTWASEQTGFPREIIEGALAHILADKTEAAYLRSDALEKRRRLMSAWAEFATSPPKPKGEVVPIRSGIGA